MGKLTHGAIAAGHPITVDAGAEMLRRGGNAFDAAVAAVFAACVSESVLTSLGGGGFLLAHTATGKNVLFDFFTQTPSYKDLSRSPHFYPVEVNFGEATQQFHIGLGAIAVPGTLAGLVQIQQRLGRLPLDAVLEPAIYWARQGSEIEPFRAYLFKILAPILTATPEARHIYAPGGQLLQLGEKLKMGDFADTLTRFLDQGLQAFYEGEIAEQIVRDCARLGGYLTLGDLQNYRVITRTPLQISYRGATLLTNPPPSSGGILIAFALRLLEQASPILSDRGSPRHLALLAQAMRLTNAARADGYDGHLYAQNIDQAFLGDDFLALYRQTFGAHVNKWGSTTHISVLDVEGNAASVTTSNGEGSSYVIPGTQVMLNNMLGEEDLNPLGFHQWPIERRMSSMMAPTIVLQDGWPRLVLGSGGSNRIRTAILQVVSNVLDFKMDLQSAVEAPRIHWEQDTLHLEQGFDREALETVPWLSEVASDHLWWGQRNMFFGGVHAVGVLEELGHLSAAGDSRRSGAIAQI